MASGRSSARAGKGLRFAGEVLVPVVLLLGSAGCVREVSKPPRPFDLPRHDFIFVGMGTDRLKSLMGEPKHVDKANAGGRMETWRYDPGVVVIVEDGRVKFKYPPSRAKKTGRIMNDE